jgi:hypothetical protein
MQPPYGRSKVGFPIRKSLDQSSFAAPQGLSQRTTSFIASQRQGIHRMLLRHLIALVIDVRFFVTRPRGSSPKNRHGHKKTSDRTVSDSVTVCLPNMTVRVGRSLCPNGHIPSSRCH